VIFLAEGDDTPEVVGVVHPCNHAGDEDSHALESIGFAGERR
jgi:hypothetical protein